MAKIKTWFCIILVVFCLSGCGIKETNIKYVETPVYVEVPIMQKPQIKPIKRPILEVTKLTDESSASEVAGAYYNSLQQMISYSKLLEKALTPFYEEYKNARGNN